MLQKFILKHEIPTFIFFNHLYNEVVVISYIMIRKIISIRINAIGVIFIKRVGLTFK